MPLDFKPPLLNSANPWATSREDLQALYDCPYTGALTTRTFITNGFDHDDTVHQYCFFDVKQQWLKAYSNAHSHLPSSTDEYASSLNTLGYSPLSTQDYLQIVNDIVVSSTNPAKPVIFSVTGTAEEVASHRDSIERLVLKIRREHGLPVRFLMEVNLSCPNIADKPPPAYSKATLVEYLHELSRRETCDAIMVGIKTPPYTHKTQFDEVISALLESAKKAPSSECPISYITATNTLGNCLVLSEGWATPAINSSSGTGIGGLAGSALHPLALGNVATLRRMLDAHKELVHIEIIGVGGVSDGAGYRRMRSVGAAAVAVGTALGAEGMGIFEKICNSIEYER